jgi:hypothetical protein
MSQINHFNNMATSTGEKDEIDEGEKVKSKINIYQQAIYSR